MDIKYTKQLTKEEVNKQWSNLMIGEDAKTTFSIFDGEDKYPNMLDPEPLIPYCVSVKIGNFYITDICCPTWETVANIFNSVSANSNKKTLHGIKYDDLSKVLTLVN